MRRAHYTEAAPSCPFRPIFKQGLNDLNLLMRCVPVSDTRAQSLASRSLDRCRARSRSLAASDIVTHREPLKPELQDPMPRFPLVRPHHARARGTPNRSYFQFPTKHRVSPRRGAVRGQVHAISQLHTFPTFCITRSIPVKMSPASYLSYASS